MANISRDSHQPSKNYDKVILQQGEPVTDYDFNETQDIIRTKIRNIVTELMGNGVAGTSHWEVTPNVNDNDFDISSGTVYSSGWRIDLTSDTTAIDEGLTLTTPTSNRTDVVYLDIYEIEIDSTEDPNIRHTKLDGTGIEPTRRIKIVGDLKVDEGTSTFPSDGEISGVYHTYLPLATLNRLADDPTITSNMIVDERKIAGIKPRFNTTDGHNHDGNNSKKVDSFNVPYDNNSSELTSNTVKSALNELDGKKLDKDGSEAMTGDLNLGGNNLDNINNIIHKNGMVFDLKNTVEGSVTKLSGTPTGGSLTNYLEVDPDNTKATFVNGMTPYVGTSRVLTTGDEGSGNGLDADLLDGNEANYFATANNLSSHTSDTSIHTTQEEVEDFVDGLLNAGDNVTLTYNDSGNTLTVSVAGGHTSGLNADALDGNHASYFASQTNLDNHTTNGSIHTTHEEVEDFVNGLLIGGSNISLNYDDSGDSLTINVSDGSGSGLNADTLDGNHASYFASQTNLDSHTTNGGIHTSHEEVEDIVGGLLVGGSNISLNYDDSNNSLTINGSDGRMDDSPIKLDTRTSDPSSPEVGQIWLRTDL